MATYCIPLTEPWNQSLDPIDKFLKSNYSKDTPIFVATQYMWILHNEVIENILSYIQKFEIQCKENNLTLAQNFRLILNRSINAEKLKTILDSQYGYNMVSVIDFFALRSHSYESNQPLPEWNSDSQKALILFGKMSRGYRCEILKDMVDKGQLNDKSALWSLNFNHPKKHVNEKTYNNIDVKKYSIYQRYPDEREFKFYGEQGYLGYPYNKDLYTTTFMSTIMETCGDHLNDQETFLSEKIWRAIANKHPFIVVCNPIHLEFLNSKGINTFESYYLEGSDYNVYELIRNFSKYYVRLRDYIKNNPEKVNAIVNSNLKAYQRLVKSDTDTIKWFIRTPILGLKKSSGIISELSFRDFIRDWEFQQYKI